MRVCLVTGEYPPDEGGVADYTRCLAEALVAEGAAVDVLTTRRPGVDPRGERGQSRDGALTVHRAVRKWHWSALGALRRMVELTRPDVVHIQYQTAAFGMHPAINFAPRFLRHETTVKVAVTYHDVRVPYLFPKAGPVREWITYRPARNAHLTIATNPEDYVKLADRGRPWHLALVPIGSNIPDAPPAGYDRGEWRRRAGIPDGAALLAYFGFLNASKGGLTLLDALATLRAGGRDVRLVMIGGHVGASDATNARYLEAFRAAADARGLTAVDTRGLAQALLWTGHVPAPEVSAWLHAADVAALPYHDGASYRRGSLLAALAHGLPVVTTSLSTEGTAPTLPVEAVGHSESGDRLSPPALPPLVEGRSALLVPPEDAGALAEALRRVLDDPALAERLGEGGRAVAEAFGWPRIAERHLALYEELRRPIA